MGFLRKVHGGTLRDKERCWEIRESLNVEPLLRTERSQLRWLGHVSRMPKESLARQILLATSTGKQPRVRQNISWSDYISNIVWSSLHACRARRTIGNCSWPWGISSSPGAAVRVAILTRNAVMKMNKWTSLPQILTCQEWKKVLLDSISLAFESSRVISGLGHSAAFLQCDASRKWTQPSFVGEITFFKIVERKY